MATLELLLGHELETPFNGTTLGIRRVALLDWGILNLEIIKKKKKKLGYQKISCWQQERVNG